MTPVPSGAVNRVSTPSSLSLDVEITSGNDARRSTSMVRSDGARSARTGTNRTASPGRHLAKLPAVAADHGHRADEAAEAWTVGAEQDRGVAGEVQAPTQ